MATLAEVYALAHNTDLRNRVLAAMWDAAEDIRNEEENTAHHTERTALSKLWAESMEDSETTKSVMRMVVQNATIQSSGLASTDSDIQFVVNGLVDYFAL